MSLSAGTSDLDGSVRAVEWSPSSWAAASIIASVIRRAPEATTPSPTAGKINTLLHWAIGIVRPSYHTGV
jgi:hypothetical protein